MINIIGQIFGTSGYSVHTRSLANALNKLTDVKLTTNLVPGWELEVNDKELEMIKRPDDFEINLVITNPVHWRSNCYAKRNWVYLVWEGDIVPKWMIDECRNENIEKIIVPSKHTADALERSVDKTEMNIGEWDYILDKVVLIPHGVDLDIFKPRQSKEVSEMVIDENGTKETRTPFKFLANKGFRNLEDRGGIQYLVKAYLNEFTKEDNIELYLKVNPAYPVGDFTKLFPELANPNAPKIVLNMENLTQEQLNNLYNDCDVFVSSTRAEAFNLPCLEALACGKPVITTNFGGQTDYCTKENSWLVDFDLTEVQHDLEYEGIKWATPKLEDLRKCLRDAFEGHEKKSSKIELTWDNTAKLVNNLK